MRKLFYDRGYDIEKDVEGYHLEFSQHSENFQSYRHFTFPKAIAWELDIVLVSESFRLSIRFFFF